MTLLTDAKVRAASATDKPRRLFDGGGLYLEVSPQGGKWWRLKYRHGQREKRLSLGTYPLISLREARERAAQNRKLLSDGVDPSEARKARKQSRETEAAHSFEALAREWHTTIHTPAVSVAQAVRILGRLERDVFPWLGAMAMQDISAPVLLQTLRRVESRGAIETAHRELQTIGQIFRYAVATGRATRDPTGDLRGALRPWVTRHMAAVTEPARVGELMRAIDGYEGSFPVCCALKLAALTFVRPGELRAAAWSEFDLDAAMWRIPAARMKGTKSKKAVGQDHLVPLSTQAVAILRQLKPLTGHRAHLFPSTRGDGRVMSDMTMGAALRRLGFGKEDMTAHGFRAMARTMLVERLNVDESIVEAQLAHRVRDALGRAYNRTQFVDQRREMMQRWADYLDKLRLQR